MIRRYGEAVRQGQHYRLRPGAYAILPRNGRLLVTFQSEPTPEIQLPGGGIDLGEQPLAALHREVFEETGWSIAAPRRVGAYRRFCYMPEYDLWAEKLCMIYLARPVRHLCEPVEPHHTALWLLPGEAAEVLGGSGDAACVQRMIRHSVAAF